MNIKKWFSFLLAALLLFAYTNSAFANGSNLVNNKKMVQLRAKGETYWAEQEKLHTIGEAVSVVTYAEPFSYLLQYPKTGAPAVDARIETIISEIRSAFDREYMIAESIDGDENITPNKDTLLKIGYETYLTEETKLTLVLWETHEAEVLKTPFVRIHMYHFDLEADTEIFAEDLMWKDFRENASRYTQNYFTSTKPYDKAIFGNYASILAPDAGRFDRFALTEEGVLFYFDRYDIFPGSYGIVKLTIPYEEMITKEPPAPVIAEEPTETAAAPVISEEPAETAAAPEQPAEPEKPKKMVALTYDDGPNPIATNAILDTLEKYSAKATFFDLGYLVERYPTVAKRELAIGCEVGSHSYDHANFNKLTNQQIAADMAKTDAAFRKAIGKSPALFRPPYGNCDSRVKEQIPMPLYLWSVDTLDWKSRDAAEIVKQVKAVGDLDGKVILMHGIYGSTAEATAQLVPYLQEQGYELVTLSELMQKKYNQTPQAKKLYGYSFFQ